MCAADRLGIDLCHIVRSERNESQSVRQELVVQHCDTPRPGDSQCSIECQPSACQREAASELWSGVRGPVELSSISTMSIAIVGTSAIITLSTRIRRSSRATRSDAPCCWHAVSRVLRCGADRLRELATLASVLLSTNLMLSSCHHTRNTAGSGAAGR